MDNLFTLYSFHEQQKEDIIQAMMRGDDDIEVGADITQSDLREIEREFTRRTGLSCKLSID